MRPGSESEPEATAHECNAVTELRDKATWIPADGGLTRLLTRRANWDVCAGAKLMVLGTFNGRSNLWRGHGNSHGNVLAKVSFATVDTVAPED